MLLEEFSQHRFSQGAGRGVVFGDVDLCLLNLAVELLGQMIEVFAQNGKHPVVALEASGIPIMKRHSGAAQYVLKLAQGAIRSRNIDVPCVCMRSRRG